MKKRTWLSFILAAALLLSSIPVLSADEGLGEWIFYRNREDTEGETSYNLSDYTGKGTSVAVIDAGFDVTHPVFAAAPQGAYLHENIIIRLMGEGRFVSEKIPFAWDYADGDGDVLNISGHGTSAASVAAGVYIGAGDIKQEDGTVLHESSFYGSAPDAQLLLMKAATNGSAKMDARAVAEAILDALRLDASAIVVNTYGLEAHKDLAEAIARANEIGVPVFAGAGDTSLKSEELSVLYTDRSTLTAAADLSGLTLIGAVGDPYRYVIQFDVYVDDNEPVPVAFVDSCGDYFGKYFTEFFAGQEIPTVWIRGFGYPEEYEGVDVEGKLAVVKRGEISFTDKAKNAAEAGAVGLIVVDAGDGVSRMALEGAPIPAVMVEAEPGVIFSEGGAVRVVFREGKTTVASFSASGMNTNLRNTVSFLCDGEGISAAVHAALSDGRNFAEVKGTDYAAAKAAGYAACVAQYCYSYELQPRDVLPLLTAAAAPLTDEDGDRLSPRLAGAGYVHGECVIPRVYVVSDTGRPVSAVGNPAYGTAYADLIIRQPGEGSEKYTLSGIVFGDGWEEKEGVTRLTGDVDPLAQAELSLSDSRRNMNTASENAQPVTFMVEGEERIAISIRLPKEATEEYESVFSCGYYLDAFVILTDGEGKEITHPITAFVGDWGASPLMDFTVYDDTPALRQKTYLSVLSVDAETDIPIGVDDPTRFPGQIYDTAYNIIPADGSTLVLSLSALRDIDRMYLTVTDSEGRVILSREMDGVSRSADKNHTVPLWDFIAEDNDEYVFPDGEYTVEIKAKTSFGELGNGENVMKFPVVLDSCRPGVVSYTVAKDKNGTPYLSVAAQDDVRLATVFAYDGAYSYIPAEGMWGFTGTDSVTAKIDISGYDYLDPLYIHVSDYAGNTTILRLTSEYVRAALGGEE